MAFWKKHGGSTEWLSNVAFFEGFTHDQIDRVARLGEEVEAKEGALLMDQGDPGQECFVVVDGQASVYAGGVFVASVGPGSMVGEMALVDHRPRNASVIADTDMRLLRFDTRHFRQLLDEMPVASERVMRLLQERLQRPPTDT
jgi:CRP-like cAMP-binding protein